MEQHAGVRLLLLLSSSLVGPGDILGKKSRKLRDNGEKDEIEERETQKSLSSGSDGKSMHR